MILTVSEARALVHAHALLQRTITLPLAAAHGYVLAEDCFASEPSPLFTNSAMDGIAVRSVDCAQQQSTMTVLRLIGESAAGNPFGGVVGQGECVHISTGAVLPFGSDAVVPRENYNVVVEEPLPKIVITTTTSIRAGSFVREHGSEYRESAKVLPSGTILNPSRIGLAAQCGKESVIVFDKPHIAVCATGNELIYEKQVKKDTNTPMLCAAIEHSGGIVQQTGVCDDTLEATVNMFDGILSDSAVQVILTTGGISVGEHDYVKKAAHSIGFETIFWRVKQKPGKPLFFAVRGEQRLFGLPGNPVSAMICYLEYIHPMLQAAQGKSFRRQTIRVRAGTDLANTHGRDEFLRVRIEYDVAHSGALEYAATNGPMMMLPEAIPLQKQDSFMLTSLTEADGFVFLEADAHIAAGSVIDVTLL
jgi:molybdopterin molybdotransferase